MQPDTATTLYFFPVFKCVQVRFVINPKLIVARPSYEAHHLSLTCEIIYTFDTTLVDFSVRMAVTISFAPNPNLAI